jgi:hypothetical protein
MRNYENSKDRDTAAMAISFSGTFEPPKIRIKATKSGTPIKGVLLSSSVGRFGL